MSFEETLTAVPDRVFISNLSNGTTVYAQYNPPKLEESIGADYGKQKVVGLSHQVKQFINTQDYVLDFNLHFNGQASVENHKQNLEARRLLQAWCYPRGDANSVGRAGAPRVLFFWPSLISMTCVITSLKFTHDLFNKLMEPIQFDVKITLEEMRDQVLFMDVAEDVGTIR